MSYGDIQTNLIKKMLKEDSGMIIILIFTIFVPEKKNHIINSFK